MRPKYAENVARRKLEPLPVGFEFCGWEIIGPDTVVFSGGVARKITRGKRKGNLTWDKVTHKVAVTKAEELQEASRYERETGKCSECSGTGQMWFGWNTKDGNRYKQCTRCGGSGNVSIGNTEKQLKMF